MARAPTAFLHSRDGTIAADGRLGGMADVPETRAEPVEPAAPVHPRSTAAIFGHPIHPMLVPFPIVCFVGALLTDIAYACSANIMWANFSIWLITAGLVMGALAALAGLVDYLGSRAIRALPVASVHMVINLAVWVIQLLNAFVHSRDGWTSVVPTGLTLSIISVLLLLVSGWLGGHLVYRNGVGVRR